MHRACLRCAPVPQIGFHQRFKMLVPHYTLSLVFPHRSSKFDLQNPGETENPVYKGQFGQQIRMSLGVHKLRSTVPSWEVGVQVQWLREAAQALTVCHTSSRSGGGYTYAPIALVHFLILDGYLKNSERMMAVVKTAVLITFPMLRRHVEGEFACQHLPSPSTICRYRLSLDVAFMMMKRKEAKQICPRFRALLIDASPQGRTEWLLLESVEIESKHCWDLHLASHCTAHVAARRPGKIRRSS